MKCQAPSRLVPKSSRSRNFWQLCSQTSTRFLKLAPISLGSRSRPAKPRQPGSGRLRSAARARAGSARGAMARMAARMPGFSLITFGCQMNQHDSERIGEVLRDAGYVEASGPESADVVVLNTCSVREKAEHKLRSEVGRVGLLKAANQI